MEKMKYILVDPNDDSGNDDGILDRIEMTEQEAANLNGQRRQNGSDHRWIKERPRKFYATFYSPEYYE